MKILVIDNGTRHLDKLKEWLGGHAYNIVDFGSKYNTEAYDLAVLSGGSLYPIIWNESMYENELELVRSKSIPVIGICLGFEIIAYAFAHTLEEMGCKEYGLVEIQHIGMLPFQVNNKLEFEAHRWCVNQLPDELVALAKSKDGVEIIQVKGSPIFGFQFHPEMTGDPRIEDVINAIQNLVKLTT